MLYHENDGIHFTTPSFNHTRMSPLLLLFFELHDDVVGLVGGAHFNVGVHEDDVGFAVLMVQTPAVFESDVVGVQINNGGVVEIVGEV